MYLKNGLIKLDMIAPSLWDLFTESDALFAMLLVAVPSVIALIIIIHILRKRKSGKK